ncbi:MAG: ribonuclease E/G [Ochrobactrum anthropi]|uniref:Ribonuclease E n=1 Tax=Brucella anthropi TaxID=529 RepID=A0A8I0T7E6_BRUAN|nr:ribonuclease E/G [Brucella anthropi]MBE0559947.1 ribonuclease E/G [Brucella anthropi]
MSNKMLIDASHPEETRVIVTRGNKIEEFDFESEHKKQLKGNIYLARVTRVEPSLQAAFVEYGGNRHGFLAFSEIHPDYYQIPVADRLALLEAEAKAARAEDDEDEPRAKSERSERSDRNDRSRRNRRRGRRDGQNGDAQANAADKGLPAAEPVGPAFENYVPGTPAMALSQKSDVISEALDNGDEDDIEHEEDMVESVGSEDALEELPTPARTNRRQYNIQEVIKRRQILLVQVVKEERGNKGAALTTYLSLAGRYSVLMPNTARGGGISRKITQPQDRKRLKEIVKELEVPQGMGVILRTAGANRTKAEVKRDYEYLMRLWENVRTLTLQSTAPSLVYEEGSLIKRSIRDLYNKDITEILVSGENGYREAKDFMRMLMPSHAKVVQPYRDTVPIFARNGIEAQLDRMVQPQVTLKSGGYIIINQTEALVAIDVNSGRSTKEHSIEDTALQTNLEAAEEVARQLRLRDLAGLIVIDFIDMEENRNNRAVEKRLKDCLKNDRARIQVGRISHFGLLEMSRQRLRASVLESTMQTCPHCGGTGHVRSESSVALLVVRAIEEFLLKDSRNHITVRTPVSTAIYVLNHKRANLNDLENRFGLTITIEADDSVRAQHYAIAKGAPAERPEGFVPVAPPVYEPEIEDEIEEIVEEADEAEEETRPQTARQDDGEGQRKRKRRRRRRKGRDRDGVAEGAAFEGDGFSEAAGDDADDEDEDEAVAAGDAEQAESEAQPKKRRRGKRGGRRNRRDESTDEAEAAQDDAAAAIEEEPAAVVDEAAQVAVEDTAAEPEVVAEAEAVEVVEEAPKKKPARRTKKAKAAEEAEQPVEPEVAEAVAALDTAPAEEAPAAKPKRAPRRNAAAKTTQTDAVAEAVEAVAETAEAPEAEEAKPEPAAPAAETRPSGPVLTSSRPAGEGEEEKPRKGGWWQRKGFF